LGEKSGGTFRFGRKVSEQNSNMIDPEKVLRNFGGERRLNWSERPGRMALSRRKTMSAEGKSGVGR